MHSFYRVLIAAHVLAAVLGLGLISAIAVAARVAGKSGHAPGKAPEWLKPLLRYSALSLAVLLVTGVLLDSSASGAWSHAWWFRGSALLLITTGALHGRTRAIVRNELSCERGTEEAYLRVSRMAFGMCGLIAVITVLMEVKPF